MTQMLAAEELCLSFGVGAALRGGNLGADAGEFVAVLGVNGAGKSSLMSAICRLVSPHSGNIPCEGNSIAGTSPLDLVRKGIVMCPEVRQLFPKLTMLENVKLGAIRTGISWKHPKPEFKALFELFPVIGLQEHHKVKNLVRGKQQMVAIRHAPISQPRLLLLDEPPLGVAPILARRIFAKFRSVADGDTGILAVEQNARLALEIADWASMIRNGDVIRHGTSHNMCLFLYNAGCTGTILHDRPHQGVPC